MKTLDNLKNVYPVSPIGVVNVPSHLDLKEGSQKDDLEDRKIDEKIGEREGSLGEVLPVKETEFYDDEKKE